MQHMESISFYFRHPKWGMQLPLGSVCVMIPMVDAVHESNPPPWVNRQRARGSALTRAPVRPTLRRL